MQKNDFTPRERLRAALEHKEPDRIPLDLGSTKMTGISIKAYEAFLLYKGIQWLDEKPEIYDTIQQIALVKDAVLEKLLVDTRGLIPVPPSGYKSEFKKNGNYTRFTDEWGMDWKMPSSGGLYFDLASSPLAGPIAASDLNHYKWPDPTNKERIAQFKGRLERVAAQGDYAFTMHGICAGVMEMALRLRGFEQFFMDLALDPDLACGIMDRVLEIKMAYWNIALDHVDSNVLVAVEADDLGTQSSLLISPEMYRRYLKPRHIKLFTFIKRKAPHIKVFMHTCGAIKPLIPDLIESGVDILNPVQVSADSMDTKRLKKEFGDVLTFWGGGIDTQKVLSFGTPVEIGEEVKRRIDDLCPQGGFVFNAIHNIQANVPPQNIEAMLDAFKKIVNTGDSRRITSW